MIPTEFPETFLAQIPTDGLPPVELARRLAAFAAGEVLTVAPHRTRRYAGTDNALALAGLADLGGQALSLAALAQQTVSDTDQSEPGEQTELRRRRAQEGGARWT